ncbi:alpha-tubulin N-acetyltransferase 2 [Drosophila teissieri]|uniref:alpha-tubulin N-acetyltransferase 2 n=1 Tax=Drosophila teissieri TaxID=7243 RepID=UPI001CB9DC05|nr:alpha-tubulin N-acetyltransferase 2 [Drosophila teissieri]
MVDFAFDIKHLFPQPIIRVQPHSLRPKVTQLPNQRHSFAGNPQWRHSTMPSCQLSQILDVMGKLSADAQGLRQPVTTADKLAADQVVYLMADEAAGHWAITGLLKVGTKDLFLFDPEGCCRRANQTPAILDFYVHESRQRCGQGKLLFEWMLEQQGWSARKCSVDRPSKKLLAFMGKHYGLVRTIPQGNNFVLYEGFFDDPLTKCTSVRELHATSRMRSQSQAQDHTQLTVRNGAHSGHFRRAIASQESDMETSLYGRRWNEPRTLASTNCIQGSRRRRSEHN